MITRIGRSIIHLFLHAGRALLFLFATVAAASFRRRYWRVVIEQIHFLGTFSLLIILLSSAFVGMVLSLQGYHTLSRFGAEGQLGLFLPRS